MPQDAFHIRRLVVELQTVLVGGKINRISQVNKDELTFIIYTKKRIVKLVLSANATGARVCLAEHEKEPAPVAPNFCMLLRKHLQNAEIRAVKQYAFERIIEITLHCTGDFSECDRILYCELMGKYSNIVLTENGVVLGALKSTALQDDFHRVLLSGAKYSYPAPQDKVCISDGAGMQRTVLAFQQTHSDGYDNETLAKYIFERVSGLALPTAREIARRYTTQDKPLDRFITEFCENEPCVPNLLVRDGEYADFFAFEIENGKPAQSLSEAMDAYYYARESKKGFADKKRKLESAVRTLKKKSEKRLQDVLERIAEAEKADENRQKGELLTANLYRIEKGANCVELENWYAPEQDLIKIRLDPLLSPAQNAQRYFKQYAKQKRALEILVPMREKERAELSYADSVFTAIFSADADEDLKEIESELVEAGLLRAPKAKVGTKKKDAPVPFREFVVDGFTVLVGRNNVQNDRLLKTASPEDIWLHTQKYHSAHAIILTDGKPVPDRVIGVCAQICAYYSSGRDGGKIPVDYCKRKYVKKPSKSRAGFVTYTDYKTVLVESALPERN